MRLTYDSLACLSARAAGGFRVAGIRRGDVVALRMQTGPEAVALLVGLWRLGAVAAPLSTRLPHSQLLHAVEIVGARVLVADDAPADILPHLSTGALLAGPPLALPDWHQLDLDAPASFVFTSGSTGTPKAALHSLGNHVWNARGSNQNIALNLGDCWLLTLPLYHVGGLGIVFRMLEARASLAFALPGTPPERALAPDVTHASLVATQLYRLLHQPQVTLSPTLRALLLGGSAIPPALLGEAVARGLPVYTTYGLTEMASQVTTTPPGASLSALYSSGRLLPYREVRLSQDGEILVRGKTRFMGYQTLSGLVTPFDAAGWYATGDLGFFDASGLLHVTGRRDFLFISGGENIQPEEIEQALARVGVVQSIVVPVPDAEFGFRPVAFVSADAVGKTEMLRSALENELSRFKIPVAFLPLPITDGLKPDRKALAAIATRQQQR